MCGRKLLLRASAILIILAFGLFSLVNWAFDQSEKVASAPGSTDSSQSVRGGLWLGKLTAPRWAQPVRLALEIDGDKLYGYITVGSVGKTEEFVGSVTSGTFTLRDNGGGEWRGRLISETQITGVRPNDPEGKVLVPFELTREREILPADLPPPLPRTSSDWATFLSRFRLAVNQQQFATLVSLMSNPFAAEDYPNYPTAKPDAVVRQLNLKAIARTLAVGKWRSRVSPVGHEIRIVTDSRPCQTCKYQVALAFEQDHEKQWHWVELSYPGD